MRKSKFIKYLFCLFSISFPNFQQVYALDTTVDNISCVEQKLIDLNSIRLHLGHCELSVLPSDTNETKFCFKNGGRGEFDIETDDKTLKIKRQVKTKLWGLVSYFASNDLIRLTIYVSPSVNFLEYKIDKGSVNIQNFNGDVFGNGGKAKVIIENVSGKLDIKTGSTNLEISDIGKEVIINTGSSEGNLLNINGNVSVDAGKFKGKIQKIKGNVSLDARKIDVECNDVFRNINVRGEKCNLNYTLTKKQKSPIDIRLDVRKFTCTAVLPETIKGISNALNKIKIQKSFTPILNECADINFLGEASKGTIQIIKGEKNKKL